MQPSFAELVEYWRDDVRTSLTRLRSIYRRLELFPAPAGEASAPRGPKNRGTGVFIVHGSNNAAKEAVARFLERLNLDVTILHEQPDKGRTVIEKFEANAAVGYAVVLLTADDVGAARTSPTNLQPRARQNVLLELGYFLGTLGRTHVCALREEGVEIPSDLSGVLYVPFDAAGAWKLRLATEIKAAGIDLDLNLVM
jgi:predicted nucleotide-binding protein